jgi:hypothetical protein
MGILQSTLYNVITPLCVQLKSIHSTCYQNQDSVTHQDIAFLTSSSHHEQAEELPFASLKQHLADVVAELVDDIKREEVDALIRKFDDEIHKG